MANIDDLNITLDSILEMLSDVKAILKNKQNVLSEEDRHLLKQVLESRNQPQPKIDFNPQELEQLKAKISELKETMEQPTTINNRYTFDFTTSKNAIIIAGLVLALIISTFGNYYQYETNKRLTDNDLKFRLIKMHNGVDSAGLYTIEHLFIYERNNKIINNIRKDVVEYEQKVIERAAELERAQMKEEQAQKLIQEAEGLKNK
ncbi:MAG: hypothetical protein LBV72_05570 [Tannerella sp.]|jgi:hypothetical protein|nr:hypothetical protein [Tannerella sp.]